MLQLAETHLLPYPRNFTNEADAETVQNCLDILNAKPVRYSQAGLALIEQRTFELACAPEVTPAKLATLQRILSYQQLLEDTQRRLAQNDQRIDISERMHRMIPIVPIRPTTSIKPPPKPTPEPPRKRHSRPSRKNSKIPLARKAEASIFTAASGDSG